MLRQLLFSLVFLFFGTTSAPAQQGLSPLEIPSLTDESTSEDDATVTTLSPVPADGDTESAANTNEESAVDESSSNDSFRTAINIVFDCSGSMLFRDVESTRRPGRNVQRGEVCKKATLNLLNAIDDDAGVGLVLFGHRSYWARKQGGGYEVLLSDLGEQQELSAADVDPSFDVEQEVKVTTCDRSHREKIEGLIDSIEFHTGAQTPLYQSIAKAAKTLAALDRQVTDRDVIVITDGFNRLADAEAAGDDISLTELSSQLTESEEDSRPRVHLVLFGPNFDPENASNNPERLASRIESLKDFASRTGGSLQTAVNSSDLSDVLTALADPESRPAFGEITGEILKNERKVTRATFTVELKGAGAEPITTTNGEFRFERIPTSEEYEIVVKGVLRNQVYSANVEDVKAVVGKEADPIKVELN